MLFNLLRIFLNSKLEIKIRFKGRKSSLLFVKEKDLLHFSLLVFETFDKNETYVLCRLIVWEFVGLYLNEIKVLGLGQRQLEACLWVCYEDGWFLLCYNLQHTCLWLYQSNSIVTWLLQSRQDDQLGITANVGYQC